MKNICQVVTSLFIISISLFPSLSKAQQLCWIDSVQADVVDCSGNTFFVELNFEYGADNSDDFFVQGNGNSYGLFAYDNLPVVLGPFTSGTDIPYEFVVIDSLDESCNNFVDLGVVECEGECNIRDLVVEAYDCTSDSFYIDITFNHNQDPDSSFYLALNNGIYDYFNYSDLPLTLGPLLTGSDEFFVGVYDANSNSCAQETALSAPFCDSGGCAIYDVEAEVECMFDDMYVTINFEHLQGGSDTFELRGNGTSYGYYAYSELPITIGPLSNNGAIYEFIAIDQTYSDCSGFTELSSNPCLPDTCHIGSLEIEVTDLHADGSFDATIDFNYYGQVTQSFDVYSGNQLIGSYPYSAVPLTLENIPSRDLDYEFIKVCDSQNDCCAEIEFMTNDCPPTCLIENVIAEALYCIEDEIYIQINFDHSHTTAARFEVVGNGNNYGTFFYSSLPVIIQDDFNPESTYDLIVRDKENRNCLNYFALENPTCEPQDSCLLFETMVSPDSCFGVEETYGIWVDVVHGYQGQDRYDLFIDGDFHQAGFYSEFPLRIEGLPIGGDVHIVTVCLNDTPDEFCCESMEYFEPDCFSSRDDINLNKSRLKYNLDANELNINSISNGEIFIFDRWGRTAINQSVENGLTKLNLSLFTSGVYIAQLKSNSSEPLELMFTVIN